MKNAKISKLKIECKACKKIKPRNHSFTTYKLETFDTIEIIN